MKRLAYLLLLLAVPAFGQGAPVVTAITAVHLDARDRQVAAGTAPTIKIARATDATIALTVHNSDNTRTNITSGVLVFTVRKALGSEVLISRLGTLTSASTGLATFSLGQSDTDLDAGSYVYSIEATWSGGYREQLVKVSPLTILPTVGSPDAGVDTCDPESIVGYGLPGITSGTVGKYLKATDDDPQTLAWSTVAAGVETLACTAPVSCSGSTGAVTLSHAVSGITAGTYGSVSSVPVCAFNATGHATSCTDTAIALSASAISAGTLPVNRGGTNATAVGSAGSLCYSSAGTSYGFSSAYTAGYVWTSGGTGAPVAVATVPIANGGTNATTAATARANLGCGSASTAALEDFDAAGAAAAAQAASQPLDADLSALAAFGCSGVIARTASNTWTCRTITQGTGITVTNGDGVSGAPTIANAGVTGLVAGGGITVSAGAGSVALGSSFGGDVSGTVAAATVAKIQGTSVSASSPASGQYLRYDGTSWAPFTPPIRRMSTIVAGVVARGTAATALGGGSFTIGCTFCLDQAGKLTAAQFYWPGGATKTVKVSLWKGSSKQESVNVACSSAGIYTATWVSGGSSGAYAVTGTDIGARWTIGAWVADGTVYVPEIPLAWWPSTEEKPPQHSSYGVPDGFGLRMSTFDTASAGDNRPTTASAGYYSAIDPLYTLD